VSAQAPAVPVGGKIATPAFKLLGLVALAGLAALAWRYAQGLGASTAMNDGYAFGLWIAVDVVIGTAIGCGGYAMAVLAYLMNRGQYHPLVRPAMLTGALGYSFAAFSIVIDVGRYWGIYKIPTYVTWWNWRSPLLEVALCVMTYVIVLWLEVSPAILEGWRKDGSPGRKSFAESWKPKIDKAMPWIIALGLLLPTMHQSSLGTVMALPASKVHKLWHSSMLPLLFLVNCLFLGYAAVIVESSLSALAFRRKFETKLLGAAAPLASGLLWGFLAVRFVDLVLRGRLGLAFGPSRYAFWFWVETALLAIPAVLLLSKETQASAARLFRCALFIFAGAVLYRFDTYILSYDPGPGWTYFPSVLEMLITGGLVAMETMIYLAVVRRFPVLAGAPAAGR
jgi:Ni/Fe-hydrogenase subunit HybB-like protein